MHAGYLSFKNCHSHLRSFTRRQHLLPWCVLNNPARTTRLGYPLSNMGLFISHDWRWLVGGHRLHCQSANVLQSLSSQSIPNVSLYQNSPKARSTTQRTRYLICLTIAPCFLSAGIYLCLSRIIVVCGEHHARFKPKTYTIIFISCDVFSLVLQALGGALADTAKPKSSLLHTGVNIMIAGLAFQVISLTIFMLLCGDFARRVIKHGASPRDALRKFGCSRGRFHGFLAG